MIFLINENKELVEIIEEKNFSQMGVWEVTHMEKWIAEHPEILGEPLFIISTEYSGFIKTNRRLDIMAIDTNGKLVIIELKRDVADSFVDLQAIHYAAYCSTLTFDDIVEIASEYNKNKSKKEVESDIRNFIDNEDFNDLDNQPRIIIVANDFKEDTLPAVLWLRDFRVDITCVKLEAHQLGKKIIITPDVIIPLPEAKEFMEYREIKTNLPSKPSKRQEQYKNFWSLMIQKLLETKPDMNIKVNTSHFLKIPSGYPSIHFEWFFRGNPTKEFIVGLHFESNDQRKNLKILKYFETHLEKFENIIPSEDIIFDKNFFNRWAQIAIIKENGDINDENMEWGFETMMKFYDALKPMLDQYFNQNNLKH